MNCVPRTHTKGSSLDRISGARSGRGPSSSVTAGDAVGASGRHAGKAEANVPAMKSRRGIGRTVIEGHDSQDPPFAHAYLRRPRVPTLSGSREAAGKDPQFLLGSSVLVR